MMTTRLSAMLAPTRVPPSPCYSQPCPLPLPFLPATHVLLLLPVVAVDGLDALVGERDAGDSSKWDTLVCRAEENIKFRDGGLQSRGKGVGSRGEEVAIVQQSGVEEVWRFPARLESELAKEQNASGNGCLDEVRLEVRGGHCVSVISNATLTTDSLEIKVDVPVWR